MKLSPKEYKVWTLVVQGYSDKEICTELKIAYGTLRTHIDRGILKLQGRNRTNAAVRFFQEANIKLQ